MMARIRIPSCTAGGAIKSYLSTLIKIKQNYKSNKMKDRDCTAGKKYCRGSVLMMAHM
jgi:hypothetical protein